MPSPEQIIRPFETPRPFDTRVIIAATVRVPTQTAHVRWGAAGTLPSAVESGVAQPAAGVSWTGIKLQDTHVVEKSRQTERIKIQQEGKPENFVIIERVKSISFGPKDSNLEPVLKTAKDAPETAFVAANEPGQAVSAGALAGLGDVPGVVPITYGPNGEPTSAYIQYRDRVYKFAEPMPQPNAVAI